MFEQITDSNWQEEFNKTENGLCLFFKKLCPHCKNMEKVLEKVLMLDANIRILAIDVEENPSVVAAQGVERPPTILVIRNGVVKGKKVGLMNPKETLAFYKQSV